MSFTDERHFSLFLGKKKGWPLELLFTEVLELKIFMFVITSDLIQTQMYWNLFLLYL